MSDFAVIPSADDRPLKTFIVKVGNGFRKVDRFVRADSKESIHKQMHLGYGSYIFSIAESTLTEEDLV